MKEVVMLLGEPIDFWIELRDSKDMNEIDLIKENSELRAKVSYYESYLDKINKFRNVVDGH